MKAALLTIMAESTGDVVFRVDQSDLDSNIWDDSALIKAYDKAISSVKDMTKGDEENAANRSKSKRKRGGKKKGKKPAALTRWKKGDHCKSVFTEDDQVYSAVISSVNPRKGSCVIRYVGYGNEEEKRLSDLLTESEAENQSNSGAPLENGYDSMEWTDPSQSPMHPASSSGHMKRNRLPGHSAPHPYSSYPPPPPGMHYPHHPPPLRHPGPYGYPPPPAPPPPPPPPAMTMPYMSPLPFAPWGSPNPHIYQGWGGSPTPNTSHQTPPRIPPMPSAPPPHPPLPEDVDDKDKEALHSMLMSWYMSGYHTGYYQGLKEGKDANSPTPKQEECDETPKLKQTRQASAKVIGQSSKKETSQENADELDNVEDDKET